MLEFQTKKHGDIFQPRIFWQYVQMNLGWIHHTSGILHHRKNLNDWHRLEFLLTVRLKLCKNVLKYQLVWTGISFKLQLQSFKLIKLIVLNFFLWCEDTVINQTFM